MDKITDLPLDLPSVSRKKVTAAFDGGLISSDSGVMLLSAAERRIGIIDRLWRLIPDRSNPLFVTHSLASILKARIFAIACGYEDGNDLGFLAHRPCLQARLRPPSRERQGSVLATDVVALGECPRYPQPDQVDPCTGRSVLRQFRVSHSHSHNPRYRRHRRCRSWPPAVVALQWPRGRVLFQAHPRLRRGHGPAGRGHPAAGQNAFRQRSAWLGPQDRAPDPTSLAQHPHYPAR